MCIHTNSYSHASWTDQEVMAGLGPLIQPAQLLLLDVSDDDENPPPYLPTLPIA